MTDKQKIRVKKIIDFLGTEYVKSYIQHFYTDVDIDNLTKECAQKIITGLGHRLCRPITGVYLRDIY